MNNIDLFGDFKPLKVKTTMQLPLVLILDTSGSMNENIIDINQSKISFINENMSKFVDHIKGDFRANKISDVMIVTFGPRAMVHKTFGQLDNYVFHDLKAYGPTPLGDAMRIVLKEVDKRIMYY